MFTNAHKSLAVLTVLGLSTIFLGFGWSMHDIGQLAAGDGPKITSPDSVARGGELPINVSSDHTGLRIVVTDATGKEIYNSDDDPGAHEDPNPEGDGSSLTTKITVPTDAEGPLTITAQDDSGSVSTKTVTLTDE